MPQEPKKRHSRQRQGKRRASIKLKKPRSVVCKNCGDLILSHTVCKKCGYYKERKVVDIKIKKVRDNENKK
ncbi:MAG: 50S ribosomal protein L32 [Candidatus Levybacteria bacterium]|nr:50S ribosomal protein L32 [Candidatus Levybacteria bacterium]